MPLRDSWHRALIFSGLVDDHPQPVPDHLRSAEPEPAPPAAAPAIPPLVASGPPAWEQDASSTTEDPTTDYRADDVEQIVVRRLPSPLPSPAVPARDEIEEIFAGDSPAQTPAAPARAVAAPPPPPPPPSPAPYAAPPAAAAPRAGAGPAHEISVLRVAPRSFNDAQVVADRFKAFGPVVLDMQGVETDLAKRLIGFASGLTYGLDGAMERLDDRVFLLTPRGVEIPSTQRSRLAAQGSLHRV
ncbi:MAG: cell division inhibitor SepF [Solirubrobacteraceae bacterium]|jgi:cell division inhibitor SepF|nr:cell division inhibitor SepF [Solirubrobacteraceae bacterium]